MAAQLTTLASFDTHTDGAYPNGSLITDAAGDLFGTTSASGVKDVGLVFEIAKTSTGYAAPTVLASFNDADGNGPMGSLITDAAGDLFGTTAGGGANGDGEVFEIAKTATGYATKPKVLASFNSTDGATPYNSLIMDAAGNLFGTTEAGGAYNTSSDGLDGDGTIFELTKTGNSYSSTPTVLASFNGTNGQYPVSNLITDAAGDLFGTAYSGGANTYGSVVEIAKTATGYGPIQTLVSFDSTDGAYISGSLIADAAGNLFGTTQSGGANGYGEVFEIAKTASGYANTPMLLVSFSGANGSTPYGSLIMNSEGDLFGTTQAGGAHGYGEIFEIAKTSTGYASAPTVLSSFTYANGAYPVGSLNADAAGDLFGTTLYGGANGYGTVFELTDSGFAVPQKFAFDASATVGAESSAGTTVTLSGTLSATGSAITSVDVYNGAVNAADLIGTAILSDDGAWSLSTTLGTGSYGLKAVAHRANGSITTVSAPYHLQTGISGFAYATAESVFVGGDVQSRTEYDSSGAFYHSETWAYDASGNIADTINTTKTGVHTVTAHESGLTLSSASDGKDTFYFSADFGTATLANFSSFVGGSAHDHVSLSSADFTSFNEMLASTVFTGGNAIITSASTHDQLVIDNISQATLTSHPGDFTFRPVTAAA